MESEKRLHRCYRCGHIFKDGERWDRVYVDGRMLPACRDDRLCGRDKRVKGSGKKKK
jgi:predicted  nucleic acid-binding Zn-ribbon protein